MSEDGNSGKRSWPELVGEDGNKAVKIIEEENPNVVVVLQAGPEIISKPLYGPDGSIIGHQAVSGRPPYAVPPSLAVVEVGLDIEGKVEKVVEFVLDIEGKVKKGSSHQNILKLT